MKRTTNYKCAVNWLHNSFILCNNIIDVDGSVFDNCRFDTVDENDNPIEIYQWFITDASEDDVKWLEKSFGLLFSYSDKLGLYVLCVDHWGTSWDSVPCPCYNDDIKNLEDCK